MIAATLFSGIGAPEVAMPHWRWAWHAEIEKFPSAVLAARQSHSVNLGDVTAHDFTERAGSIASPTVLVFGSPCQSFSVAGKRLGLDDPRGNLALVALALVGRLRPRWFVFENVPGLLSSDDGRDFGSFLGLVGELRYGWSHRVLDAQYFGVPQRRRRVFVVGYLGDRRPSAAVLFEPESLRGDSPPRRQTGEGIAPTIASRPTGGGGLGTDFDCDGGLIAGTLGTRSAAHPSGTKHESDFMVSAAFGGNNTEGPIDVATARNAHGGPHGRLDFESETFVTHALRADGFDASEDGTGRGTPLVPIAVALRGRDGGGTAELSDIPSALRSSQGGGDKPYVLTVADTLTAYWERSKGASAGNNQGVVNPIIYPSGVRRLTPRECERLQGFPDDYTLIDYRGKPAADGPRYKALGNSMAVPVIRWILTRIELFETKVRPIIERAA